MSEAKHKPGITPERIAELEKTSNVEGWIGRGQTLELTQALRASLKDGERLDWLEALGVEARKSIDAAMKKEG